MSKRSLEFREYHQALHNYWELNRKLTDHGFTVTFLDIPIVNEYFREKLRSQLGKLADYALALFSPDSLPIPLKTNFFVKASLQ